MTNKALPTHQHSSSAPRRARMYKTTLASDCLLYHWSSHATTLPVDRFRSASSGFAGLSTKCSGEVPTVAVLTNTNGMYSCLRFPPIDTSRLEADGGAVNHSRRSGLPRHRADPLITLVVVVSLFLSAFSPPPASAITYPGEHVSPSTGTPMKPIVTRPFENPTRKFGPGHRGIDVYAPVGSIVRASGDGLVRFAGVVVTQPTVSIYHAGDIITTYQPVTPMVATGQAVHRGDPIGMVANVPSSHIGLHWGAKTGPDSYMDPLKLLVDPHIRLIPTPVDIRLAVLPRRVRTRQPA